MVAHQIYAEICNGEVKNVMVCENYELANQIAHITYGEEAFAVDCTQYPCGMGDKYIDGVFYTPDGTPIEYVPTEEQQVEALQAELAAARQESDTAVAELTMAMAGMMAAEGGEGNV